MMVVFCDGAISFNRTVRLYSVCAKSFMSVNASGSIRTSELEDGYENLTFTSWNFDNMSIYAPLSKRYVCFNAKWRLIGSRRLREDGRCSFVEIFDSETGYTRFHSAMDKGRYIGFTRSGKPIKAEDRRGSGSAWCSKFTKLDSHFNPIEHNAYLSGQPELIQLSNIQPKVIGSYMVGKNNNNNNNNSYNYNTSNNGSPSSNKGRNGAVVDGKARGRARKTGKKQGRIRHKKQHLNKRLNNKKGPPSVGRLP